jgi:phage tail sheath protein FI
MATLNFGTVKTPGVYIDEKSLFPPSVAQVDTSIPAFIGPTQICDSTQLLTPTRIGSMAEYRRIFGGAPSRKINVELDANNTVTKVTQGDSSTPVQYLHDSLLMYFNNGGEKCYIVSTGKYTDPAPTFTSYDNALKALLKYDEPTLIVMPDAVRLGAGVLKDVQIAALAHCRKMQDRFAILDVAMSPTTTEIDFSSSGHLTTFRTYLGTDNLEYGAAYYPYLRTSIPVSVTYPSLVIQKGSDTPSISTLITTAGAAKDSALLMDKVKNDMLKVTAVITSLDTPTFAGLPIYAASPAASKRKYLLDQLAKFYPLTGDPINIPSPNALDDVALTASYVSYNSNTIVTTLRTDIEAINGGTTAVQADALFTRLNNYLLGFGDKATQRLQNAEADLRSKSPLYAAIVNAAETQAVVLPPSGAIAGVYARTDGERGVWKSPANASLNYVTAPIVTVTDSDQESLNVDSDGKSINAIRAFSGKGTLVWGARTLAGNSQEWRYVSVRRFFIMAEESIRKATAQFVFEANDANTWVRLRTMIENFLTLQWRAGALAGAKPEQAFFVRVGLGQTMTPQDVLDGFMIVEIGMAVVRPAEFIVLRFSHKMQQA